MNCHFKVTLSNYRCFSADRPAQFEIRSGYTAFIGANNSGKSTLLRFFYEWRGYLSRLREPSTLRTLSVGSPFSFGLANGVEDADEIYCNFSNAPIIMICEFKEATQANELSKIVLKIERDGSATGELFNGAIKVQVDTNTNDANRVVYKGENALHVLDCTQLHLFIALVEGALYVPPYRNAINHGESQAYYDLSIGTAFIAMWDQWQNGGNKKHANEIHRVTQDIARIFKLESLQITPSQDRRTFQIIVNGRPYRLREQGAGLAQFIISLGNVAIKRPTMVLIDEPELNLHPALQPEFLEAMGKYSRYGVLFATHSLGLARASGDAIYSCVSGGKDRGSQLRMFENTTDVAGLLRELGFSGYRDLGYSSVLCVEGRTDTKPIRTFLRKLGKDHTTIVLPLHGSEMIQKDREHELSEIRRLADRVFVLVDSERGAAGEKPSAPIEKFCADCESFGMKVHKTELRALENYFPSRAIKQIFGPQFEQLGPYERLRECARPWSKGNNWRVANEMNIDDFIDSDLGKFLNGI